MNSCQNYTLYINQHIFAYLCKTTLYIQESRKSIKCLKRYQELIKKSKSFVSCCHMNCCLQKYTTYQFTYIIYYLVQDKFKNPKIMKIQQVHQKLHTKYFFILFKLFSICHSFEFKATQIYRSSATDLVMCQCGSFENMKEFFMMSPHVMPHPIVSRIANKCEHEPRHEP